MPCPAEEAGFIDHKDRIVFREMLHDVVAHKVAQRVRIPTIPTQERLLAPRPGSPAASARIQPVLRRSSPSNPSRNIQHSPPNDLARTAAVSFPSHHATTTPKLQCRFNRCPNHTNDLRIMVAMDFRVRAVATEKITTVMLGPNPELAAADAYMAGTITFQSGVKAHDLLLFFSLNRDVLGAVPSQTLLRHPLRHAGGHVVAKALTDRC